MMLWPAVNWLPAGCGLAERRHVLPFQGGWQRATGPGFGRQRSGPGKLEIPRPLRDDACTLQAQPAIPNKAQRVTREDLF